MAGAGYENRTRVLSLGSLRTTIVRIPRGGVSILTIAAKRNPGVLPQERSRMERMTGLEPATCALARRRSSQLSYIRMDALSYEDLRPNATSHLGVFFAIMDRLMHTNLPQRPRHGIGTL